MGSFYAMCQLMVVNNLLSCGIKCWQFTSSSNLLGNTLENGCTCVSYLDATNREIIGEAYAWFPIPTVFDPHA